MATRALFENSPLASFLTENIEIQHCNQIALSSESRISSLICVSIRRFSTDELYTYIPASHEFTIGLRRLGPTFSKRAGDFLSENINQKVSNRIRGPLEAIECEKIPLAYGISFKNPSTDEHFLTKKFPIEYEAR